MVSQQVIIFQLTMILHFNTVKFKYYCPCGNTTKQYSQNYCKHLVCIRAILYQSLQQALWLHNKPAMILVIILTQHEGRPLVVFKTLSYLHSRFELIQLIRKVLRLMGVPPLLFQTLIKLATTLETLLRHHLINQFKKIGQLMVHNTMT